MGRRQRFWARRACDKLTTDLGGKCAQCGTTENLELDCITPCGHYHHKIEWSHRISFYRAQHQKGNLQLLCEKHHNQKSRKEHPQHGRPRDPDPY